MINKKKILIIAEAGVNHNGNLDLAKKLALSAKRSGADIVKFQTWITEEIILPNTKKLPYQKDSNSNQYDMLKKLELSFENFEKLNEYCKKIKINFLSTADDVKSLRFLNKIQNFFKVGSPDFNNFQLIDQILKFKKHIFLSTGLSNIKEIKKTLNFIKKKKINLKKNITLMHCNSAYPTPLEDVNLNVLKTFKKNFDCRIGFSDHTKSIECSLGAIALGATVIEKHLTLNKKMKGPDHKASLDPSEFKTLVKKIRNLEIALGNSDKQITKSAKKNKNLMMRSIYSSKTIKKGELFNHTNITTKRPFNGGISPDKYFKLIKKKAKFSYKINQKINLKEL